MGVQVKRARHGVHGAPFDALQTAFVQVFGHLEHLWCVIAGLVTNHVHMIKNHYSKTAMYASGLNVIVDIVRELEIVPYRPLSCEVVVFPYSFPDLLLMIATTTCTNAERVDEIRRLTIHRRGKRRSARTTEQCGQMYMSETVMYHSYGSEKTKT